jgi:hypothetical protein
LAHWAREGTGFSATLYASYCVTQYHTIECIRYIIVVCELFSL